jgi:sec-independent protein translocase protein TatB
VFGLSVEHLLILLFAALFILGPERLPESTRWLAHTVRKARDFATGAQEQIRAELGPEFQELRKPLQDLQALRQFDPKTALSRYLLDDTTATPGELTGASIGNGHSPAVTGTAPAAPLQPGERPPIDPDAT